MLYGGWIEELTERFKQELENLQANHNFEYGSEFELAIAEFLTTEAHACARNCATAGTRLQASRSEIDAGKRHPSSRPKALSTHDRIESSAPGRDECVGPVLHGDCPESGMGRRHHLHLDSGGLGVPGCAARLVLASRRGLGACASLSAVTWPWRRWSTRSHAAVRLPGSCITAIEAVSMRAANTASSLPRTAPLAA